MAGKQVKIRAKKDGILSKKLIKKINGGHEDDTKKKKKKKKKTSEWKPHKKFKKKIVHIETKKGKDKKKKKKEHKAPINFKSSKKSSSNTSDGARIFQLLKKDMDIKLELTKLLQKILK
jgi:hypothetical protein